MRNKLIAQTLRQVATLLSAADETWGEIGAGRKYLVDGEKVDFEDLWLANAEDEDFMEALVALKKGETMVWGGGAAPEIETKRIA